MRNGTMAIAVVAGVFSGVVAPSPAAAGEVTLIRGKVIFKGDAAKYQRTIIDRSANPACEKEVKKVETESVIVNEDTNPITLRNVLVSIRSGLEDYAFPVPQEPATLIQHGCRFKPHILGVRAGQHLRIYNGDDVAHSTKLLSKVNRVETITQPRKELERGRPVSFQAEPPFAVVSEVFPWMKGYIAVFDHPFFGVTGGTGMYELRGMPAGNYRIEAWHESFGTQSQVVTITKGETKTVDFTFEPKE